MSAGDPGLTLIELFAHLTEVQLYRLNRVPKHVHAVLLDLLGVQRLAPSAATVLLTFSRAFPEMTNAIEIPAGTAVSDDEGRVRFETLEDVVLSDVSVDVLASHSTLVAGEVLGVGTGEPGQQLQVQKPPVVRNTKTDQSLSIGVEIGSDETDTGLEIISADGRSYAVWQEVLSFHNSGKDDRVYQVDRATGTINFGLGASGATPPAGREVRAWYRSGGGRGGNVVAGALTMLAQRIVGVNVSNNAPAVGGEDLESLDDLVARGRDAVRSLRTAVTRRDFERVALEIGGVARATANTLKELHSFARPGVVDIRIVPKVDAADDGAISLDLLQKHHSSALLESVQTEIRRRQPLGVASQVSFTRCRPVGVNARVVVSRSESVQTVEASLKRRINGLLSPQGQWPHGKMLRTSDIYEVILSEPGVRYAENVRLDIDEAPTGKTHSLLRDPHRERTVYAGAGKGIFLTEELQRGWEQFRTGLKNTDFVSISAHPDIPGLVATVGIDEDSDLSKVLVSKDGGQSWKTVESLQDERVYDIEWVTRSIGNPTLYIASRKSLRRLELSRGSGSNNLEELEKDSGGGGNGFYAVAAARHPMDVPFVAIAARELGGVLISRQGGAKRSFEKVPNTQGKDVRKLRFQTEGDRMYLWASVAATAGDEGTGLLRIEARADGLDPGGWVEFNNGWAGGSCQAFDFEGSTLVAGTNRGGVMTTDLSAKTPAWEGSKLNCGLPINNERSALLPITAIAILTGDPQRVLAGTEEGLFVRADDESYLPTGGTQFTDTVPLPKSWLYCAGTHSIEVFTDGEG
jgi:uncharacterized phage protein gp47/JayE